MMDFESLKYAELRKLAKQAGVKANQKQEKLVAALRKYYESQERAAKSKPTTPKTPVAVKAISKPTTPAIKTATPAQRAKQAAVSKGSVSTPGKAVNVTPKLAAKGTPISSAKVATAKVVTPLRTKVVTPVRPRVSTPIRAKATPSSTTKPAAPATPVTKVATPKQYVKTTPGSKKGTPRWEKKTFTSAKKETPVQVTSPSSGKRKLTNTPGGSAKKRRSTFEKVATPDICTPVIDGQSSAGRRRSGRTSSTGSPGVKDMLSAMKPEMSAAEMKESLLSVIDKKVTEKGKIAPPSSSSIPRFAAFLKQKQESKPITPGNKDWKKIHKKNFEKFDSIDVYLEKKRKRADEITASVKKARNILAEVHNAVDKLKSHKTPQGVENKKPRFSNANRTTPFKPTVLSTSSMNLNFGASKSPKTLPRKSPKPVFSLPKDNQTSSKARKSVGSAVANKTINTPFKFTGLNTTMESTKKTKFDLKASLARPITWKTHKGKLKPLNQEAPNVTKTVSTTKIKKERDQTRKNVANRRANKKDQARMARRGINV